MTNATMENTQKLQMVDIRELFSKIGTRSSKGKYADSIKQAVEAGYAIVEDGKKGASYNAIKKYAEDNKLNNLDFKATQTEKEGKKLLVIFYVPKFKTLN